MGTERRDCRDCPLPSSGRLLNPHSASLTRAPTSRSLRDVLWDEGKLYLVMEYMDTDLMNFCRDAPLDLPTIKVRTTPRRSSKPRIPVPALSKYTAQTL